MTNKTLSLTIIVVLILGILLIWGYVQNGNPGATVQGATNTNSRSNLLTSSAFYDFGTISMKNGDISKDFSFANPSNQDITIRGLETSCMCTSAFLIEPDGSTDGPFGMAGMGGRTTTNKIIRAGESRTLRVIYNPNAHGPAGIGPIDRFITITDSAGNKLQFEIKALVTP